MPVIGHAFMGAAAALVVIPRSARERAGPVAAPRWWLPALVGVSYAPDLFGFGFAALGVDLDGARRLTHSAAFTVSLSLLLALSQRMAGALSFRRTFWVSATLLWLHVLTDVAQGSPHGGWWPLPAAGDVISGWLPDTLTAELGVFGSFFLIIAAGRSLTKSGGHGPRLVAAAHPFTSWALVIAVAMSAFLADTSRRKRDQELRLASALITSRNYPEALSALDRAGKWRWGGKGSRLEYLTGVAYAGLRQHDRAEFHLKRAMTMDPRYFWAAADLALLYASTEGDREHRQLLVRPLVDRLRSEFANHHQLPLILHQIERKLGGDL